MPVNTRFKGEEARYAIGRVRATLLIVDDGFLGNNYLAALRGDDPRPAADGLPVPALPHLRTVVTVHATDDPVALSFDDFLAAADGDPRRGGRAQARRGYARTTSPTSSSPPAPPATPRAP